MKCVLIREVSSFQGVNNPHLYEVGTWSSVLIMEVSFNSGVSFKRGSTAVLHFETNGPLPTYSHMHVRSSVTINPS